MLGPPGAGKGTQAEKLSEKLGVPQISTGELFRDNIRRGTKLGLEAKRYLDAGDLVPSDLTNALVEDRISQPDAADGFILDGYPRSVAQAEALTRMLANRHTKLDAVLEFQVGEDGVQPRLTQDMRQFRFRAAALSAPELGRFQWYIVNVRPPVPGSPTGTGKSRRNDRQRPVRQRCQACGDLDANMAAQGRVNLLVQNRMAVGMQTLHGGRMSYAGFRSRQVATIKVDGNNVSARIESCARKGHLRAKPFGHAGGLTVRGTGQVV